MIKIMLKKLNIKYLGTNDTALPKKVGRIGHDGIWMEIQVCTCCLTVKNLEQ
jgi:hypothetical protein